MHHLAASRDLTADCLRFLRTGTIPVLVAPYEHTVTSGLSTRFKALTSTVEICTFLDQSTNGVSLSWNA